MSTSIFTPYQKFVIAMLAFLQFTIVLDFMIIGPLGAMLLKEMHITPGQFGWVVSVYAFSAGISGILAAGFADKFDRKKMLLVFYAGFLLGTLLCGIAPSYELLLGARIITGVFGGVIGSIAMAIIADLFPIQVRGRVMGVVQTSFAASQVLGLPLGLFLSNRWGWHAPFLMIVAFSAVVGVIIIAKLKPITGHLQVQTDRNAFVHLFHTVRKGRHVQAFAATVLLSTGGFMLMPFGSAFSVNNLGVSMRHLPWVYLATGIASFAAGPTIGRLADKFGKYTLFCIGSVSAIVVVLVYCNLGITPLGGVIAINIVLFVAIMARMISSQALVSGVPDLSDRGAFMSVNNAIAQFSGGIAAFLAGLIVIQTPSGNLENYGVLGGIVAGAIATTIALMYPIHKAVQAKLEQGSRAGFPPPGPQPSRA